MKFKRVLSAQITHVSESVLFCIILAIVGGFLDAYTFVGRGGVFCNAQTGNIVMLGIYASMGKWQSALSTIPPIVAFILGVLLAEAIKRNETAANYMDWKIIILIFEVIVLFLIGLVPVSAPNLIVTATVSLVASIQVSSFPRLVDSQFATTMCTGNLRSAAQALFLAVTRKDMEAAIRSLRYFIAIFSFLCGAVIGGVITSLCGIRAIWGTILLLIWAIALILVSGRKIPID